MTQQTQLPWGNKIFLGLGAGLLFGLLITLIFSLSTLLQTYLTIAVYTAPWPHVIHLVTLTLGGSWLSTFIPLSMIGGLIATFKLTKHNQIDYAPRRGMLIGALFSFLFPLIASPQTQFGLLNHPDQIITIFVLCFFGCCVSGKISGAYLRTHIIA